MMKATYPPIHDESFRALLEQEFESFKNMLIPSSEICFRPMVLEFSEPEHVLVGYPVEIKKDSYERFKIVYNCFFITSREALLKSGNSMEKACEKLASYLMDFELKYQLISKPGQDSQILHILSSVYDSLMSEKMCMIRTQTDIISLDLVLGNGNIGMDVWKKKNRFKVPYLILDLRDKYEEIYLHNKIFYQVLKEITDFRNCDQIVTYTSDSLRKKQDHDKQGVDYPAGRRQPDQLASRAYEILRYLEGNELILLTDHLRPNNKYKVCFEIFALSEDELQNQFEGFQVILKRSFKYNQRLLGTPDDPKKIQFANLKMFFVELNNGSSIGKCVEHLPVHESEVVYFVWLFGHYKKYIRRLYEVPVRGIVPQPIEEGGISSISSNSISEETKSAILKKVGESVKKLQTKEEQDFLLTFENNKDDIIARLGITETKYQTLVQVLGLKEIFVDY